MAFSRPTMPSVNPRSSMRGALMTTARRSCSPPWRSRMVRPSCNAVHASLALITGVSPAAVGATQAGDTKRPITRSPESVWSR
jgi:hypothetical protein